MIRRDTPPPNAVDRLRGRVYGTLGEAVRWSYDRVRSLGAIGPDSRIGRRFGTFGAGSIVCFPSDGLTNVESIHLGAGTLIGQNVVLSAGWFPGHPGLPDRVVTIGDRCLIGRGSSVIGHVSIEIGDDVWTGHHVHITDMNHGYEDVDLPISQQNQPEAPVSIGDGSWLGHGTVVLPGARIGRHVVVGAGSVVVGTIPDFSVAVGSPARVIKRYDEREGWVSTTRQTDATTESVRRLA